MTKCYLSVYLSMYHLSFVSICPQALKHLPSEIVREKNIQLKFRKPSFLFIFILTTLTTVNTLFISRHVISSFWILSSIFIQGRG